MEKLEFKHLAPYLPYGLECTNSKESYLQTGEDRTGNLEALSINYNECVIMGDDVIDFVGLGKWCEAYDDYFSIWFDDLANIDKLVLQAPYEIFQFFLSNHYDVFGLIDKGLALNLNTLNNGK